MNSYQKLCNKMKRKIEKRTKKRQYTKAKSWQEDDTDLQYPRTLTRLQHACFERSFKQFRMFCQTVVLHLPLLFTYLCHWSQPCKPFFCKLPRITFDIITLKSISNIVWPVLWSNEICQKKYPVLLNALFWCSLTAVYCKLRGHIDLPKYAKYFQYIQYTFI